MVTLMAGMFIINVYDIAGRIHSNDYSKLYILKNFKAVYRK